MPFSVLAPSDHKSALLRHYSWFGGDVLGNTSVLGQNLEWWLHAEKVQ